MRINDRKRTMKEVRIIDGVKCTKTVDSNGRIIWYSDEEIVKPTNNECFNAYKDCPFITLNKQDAKIIFDYMNGIVGEDDDVNVLGTKVALPFERLCDRIDGRIYFYNKPSK